MTLTMDLDLRQATGYECGCCHAPIERSWNFVDRAGDRHAAYFANCYHHLGQPHEVWIDVILGTWGSGSTEDHVTFGCRVGPVEGSSRPAATLVQACMDGSGGEVHGVLLSREAGLVHPRLPEFWQVVDFVLVNDPGVRAHLYA